MTSALPANNIFDNNPFSSNAFYGRTASAKAYSPAENTFPAPSLHVAASIWQSASQDVYPINKDQGKYQAGSRRPEGLSLPLPPIGRDFSQWKTTIETEHGGPRQNEPLSAQSRSYATDSAVLTPNSLTMSDSEHSTKEGNPNPNSNSRAGRKPNPKAQGFSEKSSLWGRVGDFQTSFPTHQPKTINFSSFDQLKKPILPLQPVQAAHPYTNETQNQQLNDCTFARNDTRSMLSSQSSNLENRDTHSRPFTNGRGAYPSNVVDMSNALATLKIGQESAQFPEFYPNSRVMTSKNQAGISQGALPAENYRTDSCSSNLLPQRQGSQSSVVGRSKAHTEGMYMPTTGINGMYHDNPLPKDVMRYHGHSIQPTRDLLSQPQVYYTDYASQEIPPYQAPALNYGYYLPATDRIHDGVRNGGYGFDASSTGHYMLPDALVERPNENTQIVRSQLLEDFRMNHKTKKFEFNDIYGYIVEFSGDQLGSRFIQHKLENANSDEKDQVFSEIACDSRQLMTDVFGNYVIQKMFEHGNQSQKKVLANYMRGHVYALSTQTYGCRVVQKALEHVLTDQQASLIKELDGLVIKVVENQNGNHVIQKAIECIPGEHIEFIVKAHLGHIHYLSKHAYGCRVIQRMLEHCQPYAKRAILDELHHNIGELIQDPFGNYVVQHVIVNGEPRDRKPVIDKVQSRLLENAMHKFASNVVEKALDYADEDQRNAMLHELTARNDQGQSQVTKLLSHQYGNYVIQKSAAHLTGHSLHALIEEMEQYLIQLRRVSTGKQVVALEDSIRTARGRLNNHRQQNSTLNAPTQPNKYSFVRC